MDPYDSDSSGLEDDGEYTETGVLLGYASKEVADDPISHLGGWPAWLDEATPPPGDFANCKVCNRPMLLILELNGDLPEYFPNDERRLYIFGCPRKACNRKAGSIRALRAVRKLKVEEPKPKAKNADADAGTTSNKPEPPPPSATPKRDLGTSLFGATSFGGSSGNANPFSSGTGTSSSTQPANPFASSTSQKTEQEASTITVSTLSETFADKVRLSSPPASTPAASSTSNMMKLPPESVTGPVTPWPPKSAFPAPYPQYYLDAEYETLSRPSSPDNLLPLGGNSHNITVEDVMDEGTSTASDIKDAFESDLDKAFLRFSTRLAHNPEQVLRYEFKGSPLLYSYTDDVGRRLHPGGQHQHQQQSNVTVTVRRAVGNSFSSIPRCEYCGGERVFELQLVPHAISVLEDGQEGLVGLGSGPGVGGVGDGGMEWGTVILGVCAKDCGPMARGVVGWREEWVGVQWEETK